MERHSQPGSSLAIVGAGPIGLAAILTSPFYSPSEIFMIDLDDTAIEAVAIPATFNLCEDIVAPDGRSPIWRA